MICSTTPIRLGFLVPERNVTCETEFPSRLPFGVTAHFSRLPRSSNKMEAGSLVEMMEGVELQAALLSQINIRVIMAACTSGTFIKGPAAANTLGNRIQMATGIPGFTTTTAVTDALRALSVERFFMITPYPEEINIIEAQFFETLGFEITGQDTFSCKFSELIPAINSLDVAKMARRHIRKIKESDALFISCTNLATMDVISTLEKELGKPVISSNSATLWRAFRAAKLKPCDIGAGCLFETPIRE